MTCCSDAWTNHLQHHPELKDVWGDLKAKLEPVKPTTMEAHPSLKLTLLPFQKESLYWMKQQEKGPWKGGMLADESELRMLKIGSARSHLLMFDIAF